MINLFNGAIPLIDLQLSAVETSNGDIAITFVKIMDVIERGTDEEEYSEPINRTYWEVKTKNMLNLVDLLFDALGDRKEGYDLNYTKFYIGLSKNGVANNFISFVPKKNYIWFRIRARRECEEVADRLEQAGIDVKYSRSDARYEIKLSRLEEFELCRDDITFLVDTAKDYCGAD